MWRQSIGYEIQELLGVGSQGQVFKALRRDPATNMTHTLAVEILHSETAVDLWKREFESLHKVRSPFCVQVHAFERLNKRPALVLEFVDGVSLSALGKSCWLDEDEIAEILAQAESGLLDLYKYGVFHGDLSPHNILIDRNGHLRLLDFGLANCAGDQVRLTPEFAAPERLVGAPANLASDIFSLGRVEQFLRGQAAAPDPASPYLHIEPARRSLRGLFSNPERQAKLGARICAFQARQKASRDTRTKTQVQLTKPQFSVFIVGIITSCLLMLNSSTGQSTSSSHQAVLQIRTLRWHYFHLNGSPLGYSPVNVPLEGGRAHHLEWVSEKSRGSKVIEVPAGRVLPLQDRDFLH